MTEAQRRRKIRAIYRRWLKDEAFFGDLARGPVEEFSDTVEILRNLGSAIKRDGKFRAQLLNVLHKHLNYRLYPDEVSVVMYLKDVMLAKHYYRDFKSGFCIWLPEKIDWPQMKTIHGPT